MYFMLGASKQSTLTREFLAESSDVEGWLGNVTDCDGSTTFLCYDGRRT